MHKWILSTLILLTIIVLTPKKEGNILDLSFNTLHIESSMFEHNGFMSSKYTGRGEDISPELTLIDISPYAKSIAIIMDDHNVPFIGLLNHWVIWNIPVQNIIPENVSHGSVVDSLGGAVQGIGYGKHRYRGPKPPFFIKKNHHYEFHVYVLDCMLEIDSSSGKKELLKSMDGHIIQHGSLVGKFKND